MAVSRRLRFEILRRDNYTCRYCGASAPDVPLTVDHVLAIALGGGDEPTNLVTACQKCNAGKSSVAPESPLVADVDAAALLFAKAVEKANEIRRSEIWQLELLKEEFRDLWIDWTWTDKYGEKHTVPMDPNWEYSVEQWLIRGLDLRDLQRLIPVTMTNTKVVKTEKWTYFCGCCWKELTTRQELARRLIEDGDI